MSATAAKKSRREQLCERVFSGVVLHVGVSPRTSTGCLQRSGELHELEVGPLTSASGRDDVPGCWSGHNNQATSRLIPSEPLRPQHPVLRQSAAGCRGLRLDQSGIHAAYSERFLATVGTRQAAYEQSGFLRLRRAPHGCKQSSGQADSALLLRREGWAIGRNEE
jgi:hypothetical protein